MRSSVEPTCSTKAPGSTVNLLGGSWQPGESVHINVNDNDGQTWVRNVDVSADANGDITDTFNLPNWFVATYSVTATGASGSSSCSLKRRTAAIAGWPCRA